MDSSLHAPITTLTNLDLDRPPRPVQIDWTYLVKRRPAVLAHSELPPYLLLPVARVG